MKIVRWSFQNLHMPMMADQENVLWCTSQQLCNALQLTPDALRMLRRAHRDEFDSLSVIPAYAKEFLKQNKAEFGVKRVRNDITLWSEDDMILVAILAKSQTSKEFRKDLVKLIKEQASRGTVSREVHDQVLVELGRAVVRLENLEKLSSPDKTIKLRLVQ